MCSSDLTQINADDALRLLLNLRCQFVEMSIDANCLNNANITMKGGRPDLAGEALPKVKAATLLIVGGEDHVVIELNEQARAQMKCECKIEIVPGATHLFEEPVALDKVAKLASNWFVQYIGAK